MSRLIDFTLACCLLLSIPALAQERYPGIGRSATRQEIAAWDIDVRADFKGLPPGSGTVAKGMAVWDGKCASCHGSFGESNDVFTPLIGGTTQDDIRSGHVAALRNNSQPQRTTMMKLAQVSTLWDYINRAMPWTAPRSLSTEEVYAVTAYILRMAEVVPDDFTLSNENIAQVQQRLPNRNGMSSAHGMWQVGGKPDVRNPACMSNCAAEVRISSTLPEHARDSHGNLAQQNRLVGATRGIDTMDTRRANAGASSAAMAPTAQVDGLGLLKQHACLACHGIDSRSIGPGFSEIRKKYQPDAAAGADVNAALAHKIRQGGQGTWGAIPMPAQEALPDADIQSMVKWILSGPK